MKTTYLIIPLLALSMVTFFCSDSGNNPGNDSQPGRRDYTWTEDTLKLNDNILTVHNIWGKTPDDIWAGGTCTSGRFTLWHWNGNEWKTDSIYRHWDVSAIHGLTSHAVWCAYNSGDIQYYNGESWGDQTKISINGYDKAWLVDICGERIDHVYGVGAASKTGGNGYRAILFKYDNDEWNQLNIPTLSDYFVKAQIDDVTLDLFISSMEFTDTGIVDRIYLFRDGELSLLLEENNPLTINKVGDHVYILTNEYMYSSEIQEIMESKTINILQSNASCTGRSEKDIIQLSGSGYYHFDGTDRQLLYGLNRENYGMILFEKDFFALTIDKLTGQNIVLHGILTNSEE